jgi:hypothetical protein
MSLDGFQKILNRIKARHPELAKRLKESEAVDLWETVVGPQIAKHSRVLSVENSIFHVEIDHPAWKAEVHARKKQILDRLNDAMKEKDLTIQDLFLVEKRYSSTKGYGGRGSSISNRATILDGKPRK